MRLQAFQQPFDHWQAIRQSNDRIFRETLANRVAQDSDLVHLTEQSPDRKRDEEYRLEYCRVYVIGANPQRRIPQYNTEESGAFWPHSPTQTGILNTGYG